MRFQSELTDTLRRKGEKGRIVPASIPQPPTLDQRERGDGSSEQSNTTAEFPECSTRHHMSDNLAEKRRHRQSWESMVNTNNGCIDENNWIAQSTHAPSETAEDSGGKRVVVVYPRTAGQQSLPLQSGFTGPKNLINQSDSVQPLNAHAQTERLKGLKKDTEV